MSSVTSAFQSPAIYSCKQFSGDIQVEVDPNIYSPEVIVKNLASIRLPLDVYCWFEGSSNLPTLGATFMRKNIFEPLNRVKKDARLCLYSLRAWDFKKIVDRMPSSTPIGEAINRINATAIRCIYSFDFFRYCRDASPESPLCKFIGAELPKKEWLLALSKSQKQKGKTFATLFDNKNSLVSCIQDLDCSCAYSPMQYVEGYYLIQKSVREGISKRQSRIEIAFVLPNDESKYYQDYTTEIEKMLRLDFGSQLDEVAIRVRFCFFEYGSDLYERPYIDRSKGPKMNPTEIESFFGYLIEQPKLAPLPLPTISSQQTRPFPIDVIHGLNGVAVR